MTAFEELQKDLVSLQDIPEEHRTFIVNDGLVRAVRMVLSRQSLLKREPLQEAFELVLQTNHFLQQVLEVCMTWFDPSYPGYFELIRIIVDPEKDFYMNVVPFNREIEQMPDGKELPAVTYQGRAVSHLVTININRFHEGGGFDKLCSLASKELLTIDVLSSYVLIYKRVSVGC